MNSWKLVTKFRQSLMRNRSCMFVYIDKANHFTLGSSYCWYPWCSVFSVSLVFLVSLVSLVLGVLGILFVLGILGQSCKTWLCLDTWGNRNVLGIVLSPICEVPPLYIFLRCEHSELDGAHYNSSELLNVK